MRYNITPVSKPRQTRSDKWKQRPCVMRYRAFADEVRLNGVEVHENGSVVVFGMPMPKSWTKKKRAVFLGKAHQQKPDIDNLLKAVLDAIFDDDCAVWDIRAVKVWACDGFIEVIKGKPFKAEL